MAATVLITGANGFIGSHTALLFESLGHEIVPLDIVPRSRDLSLLPIKSQSHELDVTDTRAFTDLCRKEKITHIFHAAHPRRDEASTGPLPKLGGALRPAQKKRPQPC